MNQIVGILGIGILLGIAYLLSENKKNINSKTVLWGLGLQIFFALVILKTPIGRPLFSFFDTAITKLISFADTGSEFLFGSQVDGVGFHPAFESVAFRLLPHDHIFFRVDICFVPLSNHSDYHKAFCPHNAKDNGDKRTRDT